MILRIKRGKDTPAYAVVGEHNTTVKPLDDGINPIIDNSGKEIPLLNGIVDGQLGYSSNNNTLYIGDKNKEDPVTRAKGLAVPLAGVGFFDVEFGRSIRERIHEIADYFSGYLSYYPTGTVVTGTDQSAPIGELGGYPDSFNYFTDVLSRKNSTKALIKWEQWADKVPYNYLDNLKSQGINFESINTLNSDNKYRGISEFRNDLLTAANRPTPEATGENGLTPYFNTISGLLHFSYATLNEHYDLWNRVNIIEKEETLYDKLDGLFVDKLFPQKVGTNGESVWINDGPNDLNKTKIQFFESIEEGLQLYYSDSIDKNIRTISQNSDGIELYTANNVTESTLHNDLRLSMNPDSIVISRGYGAALETNNKFLTISGGYIDLGVVDITPEYAKNRTTGIAINYETFSKLDLYVRGYDALNSENNKIPEVNAVNSATISVDGRLKEHDRKLDRLFVLASDDMNVPFKLSKYSDAFALPGNPMYNRNMYNDADDRYTNPLSFDDLNDLTSAYNDITEHFRGPKLKTYNAGSIDEDWVSGIITGEDTWNAWVKAGYLNQTTTVNSETYALSVTDKETLERWAKSRPSITVWRPRNGTQYVVESFEGLRIPKKPIPFWCWNYINTVNTNVRGDHSTVLIEQFSGGDGVYYYLTDNNYKISKSGYQLINYLCGQTPESIASVNPKRTEWITKDTYPLLRGKIWYNNSSSIDLMTGRPYFMDWQYTIDTERMPYEDHLMIIDEHSRLFNGDRFPAGNIGKLAINNNIIFDEGEWS